MTGPRLIALSSNPGQVEPDFRAALKQLADAIDGWQMAYGLKADDPLYIAMNHARKVLFPRLARLIQEPTVFEPGELPPPDAAQAEGPSLADVDELCEEFEFHLEGDGLEILRDMITAAITRWPAPVAQPAAQPVNLAELHDPDFSGGLTPSQHLNVLHGEPDPRAAATASPGLPPRVGHILRLAEIIREVDGTHDLGAAALAEAILAHPGFSGCHDAPAAPPAQGEVAELVAALEADAGCVAAEHYGLCNMTADQMRRIAQLLKTSTQPVDADRGQA
jgi:hypothetical protein